MNAAPAPAAHNEQATVRPPFDPAEFARQSEMSTIPPPARVPDLDPVVSTETTLEVLFVDGATVPALAVAREDLEWFELSPGVRELVAKIDGETPLEKVCAQAGRSLDDGISQVEQLVRDGVVVCR